MNDLEELRTTVDVPDSVRLSGEYDMSRDGEMLHAVLSNTTTEIVSLDMSAVQFIDASGFGALIRARAGLNTAGRRLRLVNLPDPIRRLIGMLQLGDYLDAPVG